MITTPVVQLLDGQLYHNKSLVLSKVNIKLNAGEFAYLIGKTGSGKSTILKTLYAHLPIKEGLCTVAGYNLNKIKKQDIPFFRRKLGIIFQDFQLLSDRSIYNNLIFVLKATGWQSKELMDARIKEVLKLVSLDNKEHKMPHQLSGGEQQKVAIARALLNNPSVILADEPTGNLDPELGEEILMLFSKIRTEGAAVLIATHDYRLIDKFPAEIFKIEGQTLHAFS
ncbi:MAG: ATP-binding cassette domain-containing protein [Bacteroidota bacterium]|nr:ATP-binding cassette domain-containing protein [Bacteroidota bacterium]